VPNDGVVEPVAYIYPLMRNLPKGVLGDSRQQLGRAFNQVVRVALMSSP